MAKKIINNRYLVIRKLGRGGMGAVFLVEDSQRDARKLALKTIRADRMSEGALAHFKREFTLLTELRHPNLEEVYDFGALDDGSGHFFTSEYIEGTNILEASHDQPYETLYELLAQTCRALEFIHNRGFIHYDIKPTNVLVTRVKTRVKIVDFGLAGEAITSTGTRIRGTIHYLAPEVIKGLPADRRADLYSLGITLYQLATRSLPFDASSSLVIIRKHLEAPIPSIKAIKPDVPEPLIKIVTKLMAKDPADRYPTANEVILELSQMTGLPLRVDTAETKRSYIQSGKFLGRESVFDRLKEIMRIRCLSHKLGSRTPTLRSSLDEGEGDAVPSTVLVTGERGIGKSRLMREFRIASMLAAVHFFSASCSPSLVHDRRPLGPFADIVADLLRFVEGFYKKPRFPGERAAAKELVHSFLESTATLAPAMVEHFSLREPRRQRHSLLDTLDSRAPSPRSSSRRKSMTLSDCGTAILAVEPDGLEARATLSSTETLDAESGRICLSHAISCLILGAAEFEPFVLLVENLQWCDEEIANLFTYIARSIDISSKSIFLCGTLATDETTTESLRKMMKELGNFAIVEEHALSPLTPREVAELLHSMLGLEEDETRRPEFTSLAQRLSRETGGNPYFIEEMVKMLVEDDLITRSQGQWTVSDDALSECPTPRSVVEVIRKRLSSLDEHSTRILSMLAVFNKPMPEDLLMTPISRAGGPDEPTILQKLRELALAKIVLSLDSGDGRTYSICHQMLHKTIYESIPEAEKKSLHHTVATILEKNLDDKLATVEDLAIHYIRAGIPSKIRKYAPLAAQRMKAAYASDGALFLYENVKPLLQDNPSAQAAVLEEMAELHELRGRFDKALDCIHEIQRIQPQIEHEPLAALLRRIAEIHIKKGDFKIALAYLSQARDSLRDTPPDRELARVHTRISQTYFNLGNYQSALEAATGALALIDESRLRHKLKRRSSQVPAHDPDLALSHSILGRVLAAQGKVDSATEHLRNAVETFEALGDVPNASDVRLELGHIIANSGDHNEAMTLYQKSLREKERIGDRRGLSRCLLNIGTIHMDKGDLTTAIDWFQRAHGIAQEVGDRQSIASCFNNMAIIEDNRGAYPRALKYHQKSLDLSHLTGDKAGVATSLINLSNVHSHMGEHLTAIDYLRRAAKTFEEIGNKPSLATCLNNLGTIYYGRGRYRQAEEYFARSLSLHEEIAEKHGIALTLGNLALVFSITGNFSKSEEFFHRSIELREELEDKSGMGYSLAGLGALYWGRGRYKEAISHYRKALLLREEVGVPRMTASTLMELASIHTEKGELAGALELLERATKITRELGDPVTSAEAGLATARILAEIGSLDDASGLLDDVLAPLPKKGNAPLRASADLVRGIIARTRGEIPRSIQHIRDAVSVQEKSEDKVETAKALLELATTLLPALESDSQQPPTQPPGTDEKPFPTTSIASSETFETTMARGRALAEETGSTYLRARTTLLESLAELGGDSPDLDEVWKKLHRVDLMAAEMENSRLMFGVHHAMGNLYFKARQYRSAFLHYKRSLDIAKATWRSLPAKYRGQYLSHPERSTLRLDMEILMRTTRRESAHRT